MEEEPIGPLELKPRPVKCAICKEPMHYHGDHRYEEEVAIIVTDTSMHEEYILTIPYIHKRCAEPIIEQLKALLDEDEAPPITIKKQSELTEEQVERIATPDGVKKWKELYTPKSDTDASANPPFSSETSNNTKEK